MSEQESERQQALRMKQAVHTAEALESLVALLRDPDLPNKATAMARIWVAGYIMSHTDDERAFKFIDGLSQVHANMPPAYRESLPLAFLEAAKSLAEYAVNAGVWLAISTLEEDGISPADLGRAIEDGAGAVDYGNVIRSWLSSEGDAMPTEDGDWMMVSAAVPWRSPKEAADQ